MEGHAVEDEVSSDQTMGMVRLNQRQDFVLSQHVTEVRKTVCLCKKGWHWNCENNILKTF